jgi:hypothetical protein
VRRLAECQPRSLRVAVLLDKPEERRVPLQPDYLGFSAASKYLVGYGLPDAEGLYRNLSYIASPNGRGAKRESKSSGRAAQTRRRGGRGRDTKGPAR